MILGTWMVKKCDRHDRSYNDVVFGHCNLEQVECGCLEPVDQAAWHSIEAAKRQRSIAQGDNAFGFVEG